MKIDYISDLHIDFYISSTKPKDEFLGAFERFQSIIYPFSYKPGKVLILSGDISHHVHQIIWILEYYASFYDYVLYTHGNHEMYCLEGEISFHGKLNHLIDAVKDMDNVYYMDGDSIEIDGFKIGGLPMWYDFSYGQKHFNMTERQLMSRWVSYMTDARKINDGVTSIKLNDSLHEIKFDALAYFKEQEEKLWTLYDCDLIFSHVMPFLPNNYPQKYCVPETSYFVFDAENFISNSKVKRWICGHTHTKVDGKKFGVRLYANPYGYPNENWDKQIRHIEV